MAKLCYKYDGTVKKYDLKDSVNGTPKLCVKVGGLPKYLGLKQGTKSGEIAVKVSGLPYYIKTIVDYTESTPVQSTGMTFYIAQSTADGYGWLTNDTANNRALCKMYGLSYGQGSVGGTYQAVKSYYAATNDLAMLQSLCPNYNGPSSWYYPARANAHNYIPDSWGGTGPHRMYAQVDEVTVPEHPYYHVVTRPFYFLYSDNNLKFFDHGSSDRAGDILLYGVLKNGASTRDLRTTSTPTLFEEGNTIAVIAYFNGYNTRSTFQKKITYDPIIRWAD